MSSSLSLPEEDLCCPVCCDVFRDPVLLLCSHSFCKGCLQRFWATSVSRDCPVCRRRSSKRNPPTNLALKNLCEAFVQKRSQRARAEPIQLCLQHGEKLKLFCQEDNQPICVVCQTSKTHRGHDCAPLEETATDCRAELSTALKTLQDELGDLSHIKSTLNAALEHIKGQASTVGGRMKDEFLKLHEFLIKEENARLSALKTEEAEKMQGVLQTAMDVTARINSLSETIKTMDLHMAANDLTVVRNFKALMERAERSQPQPETPPGLLIDEAKHLGNLTFRVWEKMQDEVPCFPVTLDPNTAHPCLTLSDNLTALHYSSFTHSLPSSPQRFRMSAEVLGSTGFNSGTHHWDVEVEGNNDWILGVAYGSVKRNEEISARPENGFWTMCLRDGVFRAMTSPPTALEVHGKPQRIRVKLDWERGEVSFSDPTEVTILFTFTHTFVEDIFPYFYTQNEDPLRIVPTIVSTTWNA
ncbi:tripartite motif-containing protein 35-like [Denticeps clupeoides]|uniref:Zinc-binding protein A33-like n=1 Tax=Denticeps clupeoides TaxID=299321 RepID=A0AAY4BRK4_9TELE|nr:tripartite motif-containing protein 35-like [Denticeps clupeoides]